MKKIVLSILFLFIITSVIAQNYPQNSDLLWVTTPDKKDWIYSVKEEAKISIQLFRYGIPQDVEISYKYGPEMMPPVKEGKIKLKDGKAELSLGSLGKPGFVDCKLQVDYEGQSYTHHVKVAYDPGSLVPFTQNPADFNEFWTRAKEEAAKCPMKVEKTFVKEYSNYKVDCYLIKLQTYKEGFSIYGYLTLPKKEGKFPAVFTPPGAGVKPMNPLKYLYYAENNMINFLIEIHGIRPDLDAESYKDIGKAFGTGDNNYLVNGIDDKDRYYMKKVYLSCVRALDYLTSLPEWDGKNLIAQGGSQGGALALITTALDNRVTACAANYPALSDMAGYLDNRAGGYPHLFPEKNSMNKPDIIKTLQYYDVVNFARQIKVPTFMTWGFNDNVCPPTTSYIVYNLIKSEKKALITPINEHWASDATVKIIFNWIKQQVK